MRSVLLILSCVLVLVGCPGPPGRERVTEIDQQRLEVMLNLPIIRLGERISDQRPGTLLDRTLGWDRGYVSAGLFSADPGKGDALVLPEQVEEQTADALATFRVTGWTIMSAACTAPERDRIAASGRLPEPGQLGADSGLDYWSWNATGYTFVDGVSYWAELSGEARRDGRGSVGILLRAPNVDDPSDLFPDRPAGLPAGSTCIEQPGVPPTIVEQGTRIEMSERRAFPQRDTTTDPMSR